MARRNPGTIDLDDPVLYRTLDADGMLDRLHEFPSQCRRAWDLAMSFPLVGELSPAVDKVLVLGMGGSAIGGDLVSSLALPESRVPIMVHRGYSLPAYVDSRTLVVASSYSGNTEETLACFEQSIRTGAKNLAMTTGGRLKAMAEEAGVPVFVFDYEAPPRAALPYSFMALLCFLQRLGLLRDMAGDVSGTISALGKQEKNWNESVPVSDNLAKQMARELHGRLAVVYGAEVLSEVAHRWKTQINENSKAWAFYEVFPELNHNAVVGYEFPSRLNRQIMVLMLDSAFLSRRVRLRYRITERLLKKAGIGFRSVPGFGGSRLSEVMTLVLLGDYVSYYLALLNGAAPGPVHAIDYLKAELARGGDA